MRFTQAIAAAILASAAEARTFAVLRFNNNGQDGLVTGRMDPIVNPGVPSGHSHVVQGGNAFKLDMTDDDPLSSTCTTAKIKNDNSNYWTPTMFFQDPKTGALESVPMFYMNVYYFFENDNEKVQAFPKGLRMFVGNPNARTPPKSAAGVLDSAQGTPMSVQWTCPRQNSNGPVYPSGSTGMDGVGMQDPNVNGQGVGFPDQECDGFASPLRADIHFPSCYDPSKGVRSYKDNMQFPQSGRCPAGLIRVPHLFYEVYWDTLKFKGRWTPGQGSSPWVLSNGDKTGYSLHADFINGWDEKTLQTIIDTCNAGSSGMDKCPNIIGGLNDDQNCKVENLVPEIVSGVMSTLPGGAAILKWGEKVTAGPSTPVINLPDPVKPSTSAAAVSTTTKASEPASSSVASEAAPTTTKVEDTPQSSTTLVQDAPQSTTSNAAASSSALSSSAPSSTSASRPSTTLQIVATPAPTVTNAPDTSAGGSIVTSFVSETELVYTTVTLPAPGASSAPSAIEGYTYQGCFSDNVKARVLTGVKFAGIGNKQVSTTKCVQWCLKAGFSLAGTEFGGQCFCGNTLVGSTQLAEEKCNLSCEGGANETCGGPEALSIWGTKKPTKRTSRHMHRHVLHAESH